MLEKLPDVVGHALRGQRAGLDKTVFRSVDLRAGMAAISVASLAFVDHAPIPERYTADGPGLSPPLQWWGAPAAAASLVLIVEDADAPTPHPLVHAIAVDLPAADGGIGEGALTLGNDATSAFKLGLNSLLQARWLPPDPPPGHGVHRYAFQVFAVEPGVVWGEAPGREAVIEAIREHGLASGCLIGTYERPDTAISETTLGAAAAGLMTPSAS